MPCPGPVSDALPPQVTIAALAAQSHAFRTETQFGPVVWRRWGSGPPVLLLHGSHGSWLHWVRNIAELARWRTVIVPDLPGFGDSASPGKQTSADGIAEPLAAGLAGMDLTGVDILGFSFGGIIGGHVAAQVRERIRRLVIIDTGGLGTPVCSIDQKPVRRDIEDMAAHRHNLAAMMLHEPASIDALAVHIQAVNVPLGRIDVRPMVLPDGMIVALRRSNVSVDAIWGEWDRPHPDPEGQFAALRRERPQARGMVVSGAGHWCIYENSAEFDRHCRTLLMD